MTEEESTRYFCLEKLQRQSTIHGKGILVLLYFANLKYQLTDRDNMDNINLAVSNCKKKEKSQQKLLIGTKCRSVTVLSTTCNGVSQSSVIL